MSKDGSTTAVCGRIEERVARTLGQDRFDRYFKGCTALALTDEGLSVCVSSTIYASFLDTRFGAALRDAARNETGRPEVALNWRVEPARFDASASASVAEPPAGEDGAASAGEAAAPPSKLREKPRRPQPGPSRPAVELSLKHKLDGFVVGASNRLAYESAVRFAAPAGTVGFSRLFLHGDCGVGKTHLLQGIVQSFKDANPGLSARYFTGESFTNDYITAVRSNTLDQFRAMVRRLDLLCIDDIHFLSGKVGMQREFLHTLDALDLKRKRLAIASDNHPRDIERFTGHLVSRCLSGMVVRIDPPDEPTRQAIVRQAASERGMVLDGDAVTALSSACHGSARQIEGLISLVEATARILPEASAAWPRVGAAVVRRALSDGPDRRIMRPIKTQLVAEVVCRELVVEMSEVLGRGRHKRVVLARSCICHLARMLTTQSFPEIAQALNRPNHSTVVTACKRIKEQIDGGARCGELEEGAALADVIERLRQAVLAHARSQ